MRCRSMIVARITTPPTPFGLGVRPGVRRLDVQPGAVGGRTPVSQALRVRVARVRHDDATCVLDTEVRTAAHGDQNVDTERQGYSAIRQPVEPRDAIEARQQFAVFRVLDQHGSP
jgi:hypothetical protein